jgi:hypothetical protein
MATASPGDRISVREGVSAREFDGEWVVLDLAGGNYFGLNELGGIIWQDLSSGRSPSEIARLLGPKYDVDEATILRDVLALVDELISRGLVQIGRESEG